MVQVDYYWMSWVYLEGLTILLWVRASRRSSLSFHHLHHHSHGTRHLTNYQRWCVLQSLGQWYLRYRRLKLILQPEREWGDVFLGDATLYVRCCLVIFLPKFLCDLFIWGFNVSELLVLILALLLEADLIYIVCQYQHWKVSALKRFHKGRCQSTLDAGVYHEIYLVLIRLHLCDIVIQRD